MLELFSGVLGAKKGGGTRRGMVGSVIGGLVGAFALTFFFPLVGTLVGSLADVDYDFIGVHDLRATADLLADVERFAAAVRPLARE